MSHQIHATRQILLHFVTGALLHRALWRLRACLISSSTSHTHAHHGDGTAHATHGTVDPTIVTTQRGLWAIKWSFIGLGATACLQVVIVWMSGSVALLADTIHNFGDAATALPLWMAFVLARRHPRRGSPMVWVVRKTWPVSSSVSSCAVPLSLAISRSRACSAPSPSRILAQWRRRLAGLSWQ